MGNPNVSNGEIQLASWGDCAIYLERQKNYKGSPHEAKNDGKKRTKEKEAINGRKVKEKEEILALSPYLRKSEMLLLEMRFCIRAKWGFLKKMGRISSIAKF